jgi:alpha-L-fucosidase 2
VGGRQDSVNTRGGGTYPNMFDAHPPFQIDGNFGCTAGIAEMLLQSHDAAIHILPALPDTWPSGKVTGLVARGGFVVDITWKDKKLAEVKVKSRLGGYCRLRLNDDLLKTVPANLSLANGFNLNPFYDVPQVKAPIISPTAKLKRVGIKLKPVGVKPSKAYDLNTVAGKEYIFKF